MNKVLSLIFVAALCGLASANLFNIAREFNDNQFSKDALKSWTVEGLQGNWVTDCAGKSLVGGQGAGGKASISKKFSAQFDLTSVSVSFDLYFLDSWNTGWEGGKRSDQVKVYVNGVLQNTIGSSVDRQLHSQSSNICGGAEKDRLTRVSLSAPVKANEVTIKIVGAWQDAGDVNRWSWGIRDLQINGETGNVANPYLVELNDDNNFNVSGWSSNFNNAVTTCQKKVLGGFNAAGAGATFVRKLANIPPHTYLTISLNGFFIDSHDLNDSIVFYLDGKIVHETCRLKYFDQVTQMCGVQGSWGDNVENISFYVPHTGSSAELKIYVNLDQGAGDESFGIRDFSVVADSPCPIIFEEVGGEGSNYTFCQDIPNLKKVGWFWPIRGIYIPESVSLTVYQDSDYSGKRYVIDRTNLNLKGNEYALINKAFNVDISQKKLRRNY